ncbi:MAG: hypothetical protein IPK86_04325 [Neisseriales bacterium]|nr:MAG: hypothetical protein IPK86_04325 [Neisseriales bacterium]
MKTVKKPPLESLSIDPSEPINTKIIYATIYSYIDHVLDTPNQLMPLTSNSRGICHVFKENDSGNAIITSDDLQADTIEAIRAG